MSVQGFDSAAALRQVLNSSSLPLFSARLRAGKRAVVELGTFERRVTAEFRRGARLCVQRVFEGAEVRIVRHDADKMRRIRSLEAFIARTGSGQLLVDRTMVLQRAEALTSLAKSLRASLRNAVSGIYFHSARRVMFIILDSAERARFADRNSRAVMEATIAEIEAAWRAEHGAMPFSIALRIGFELPTGLDVTAVDRATVRMTWRRLLQRPLKGGLLAAALATLAGGAVTVPAMAADLVAGPEAVAAKTSEPAVDAPNVSLGLVGVYDSQFEDMWGGLTAKGTLPVGHAFGAQLDLEVASDSYYGAGLHLFTRDPEIGLFGLVASTESLDGDVLNRAGAEFEYYLNDQFTVGGRVGYQDGAGQDGAFGRVDVKFYADPDLVLSAGLEATPELNLGRLGFEWVPAAESFPGMSVSADASFTSEGDWRAMFGLNFQIGGGAHTLLDRDRRADPETLLDNRQVIANQKAYGEKPPV